MLKVLAEQMFGKRRADGLTRDGKGDRLARTEIENLFRDDLDAQIPLPRAGAKGKGKPKGKPGGLPA